MVVWADPSTFTLTANPRNFGAEVVTISKQQHKREIGPQDNIK